MRFLALPQEGGGWSALCLDHDVASDGDTAEEAVQNCLTAVREVQAYVDDPAIRAENPTLEMQGPPPAEAIMQFFRDAAVKDNTTNAFYLLDFTPNNKAG